MSRCVIPISGGLDSTVILHYALEEGHEPHAITFNYGQKHGSLEIECAKTQAGIFAKSHKVIDLTFFKDIVNTSSLTNDEIAVAQTKEVLGDPQTVNYVPNRNMMILSICTAYAESIGADTVYHGAALVDSQAGFWDGSKEFLEAINNVNALNRRDRINIEAPLINMSKKEIVELGSKLCIDFKATWTCYEGSSDWKACGTCTACSSRLKGFVDAKMIDPLEYQLEIPWDKYDCKPNA